MSILSTIDYLNNLVTKYKVKAEKLNEAIQYLHYYGYLVKSGDIKDYTLQEILDGVTKFQEMFGLDVDGEIGGQCLKAMTWQRCGCKDIEEQREELRAWAKNKLSIWVGKPLTGLTKDKFQELIVNTLNDYGPKVCNISFTHATSKNNADIVVNAGSGRTYDFDGPSGTLAWHELPAERFNGQLDCMFDDDERWTLTKSGNGIWLIPVINHEILGHGCGLSHSRFKCLLSPTYDANVPGPIEPDDVSQLVSRYGKPVAPTPTPTPDPVPLPPPAGSTTISITVSGIEKVEIPGYRVTKMG